MPVSSNPGRTPVAAVLGGSGFIGCHLVYALAQRGYRVKALDRNPSPIAPLLSRFPLVETKEGDFFDKADLRKTLEGADVCFHLVATTLPRSSNDDPLADARSNICGSLLLLDTAVEQRVDTIVFSSSGGTVYGIPERVPIPESHPTNPLCAYGISKLAVEKFLALYHRLHGLKSCSLRLANPYGPLQRTTAEQGAIAVFMGRALRGRPVEIWGDGSVVRDFVYIDDVVKAFVLAAESGCGCETYNVGSGTGNGLNAILGMIGETAKRKVAVNYLAPRSFDVPSNILDITAIRNSLGWSPKTPLKEGLAKTWMYLVEEKPYAL
jgi:UDP-glucose 4-epimerase